MGSVLCVTRNGEGGISAQKVAITLAKGRGDPLVFLFIADSSFLDKLALGVVVDIWGILESMGRFIMTRAVGRASAEGVKAESMIRKGAIRKVLPDVVSELDATTIIIGQLIGEPIIFEHTEMDKVFLSKRKFIHG
jgi:hypothetical protein